ncbi:copper chaperone [Marininema mesophilum]|uniref:Copper chaperone n=1 Tax=Marininema mesophilum TaxID=1048340 RepID=A0A1H2QIE6_9BACL|nr:cation transporter [Marininema mesophilum]SDW06680.1 copper chaperone [Marininema mesophilum]
MAITVLNVKGMSCDHCKASITGALEKISGVDKVTVDIDAGIAIVEHQETISDINILKEAIEEQGYDVEEG